MLFFLDREYFQIMQLQYALSFWNSESDFSDCDFSKQLIENEATKPQRPPPRAGRLRPTAIALENSQPAEGVTAATQQVHHAAPRVTSQVSKER